MLSELRDRNLLAGDRSLHLRRFGIVPRCSTTAAAAAAGMRVRALPRLSHPRQSLVTALARTSLDDLDAPQVHHRSTPLT